MKILVVWTRGAKSGKWKDGLCGDSWFKVVSLYYYFICYNEVVLKTNVRDCVGVYVFIGYKKRLVVLKLDTSVTFFRV